MISKIKSGAIIGVEGYIVEVEADLSSGLPSFDVVGLPDSAVKESRERVRTAIKNTGYPFPVKRIVVNLAPADTRKEGPVFDLPIAVGILTCMGVVNHTKTEGFFITGELSLDGSIRPVNGILPMVYGAAQAGIKNCIVPFENADEASLVEGVDIYAMSSLKQLIEHFNHNTEKVYVSEVFAEDTDSASFALDFSHVKGQLNVKRALEISACGGHNVIMIGPPGSGKTMMAKRIPGILPDLSFKESIEVTKVYSVAGLLESRHALIKKRPFRSPHHTISYPALTGGGRLPKPGEISLSHNGVLFLDELPEFSKNVLEVLRQPLEDGKITISRVNGSFTYPSDFMLIASMNPCPCGYYGDRQKCTCSQNDVSRYMGKISGPLLDRIDIQVEAPKVEYKDFGNSNNCESSVIIRKRVVAVREIQSRRYENEDIRLNSQLSSAQIDKFCALDDKCRFLIKRAYEVMGLSARGYHKILKLARTIADMEASVNIQPNHLSEAIQYRSLDRTYWGLCK